MNDIPPIILCTPQPPVPDTTSDCPARALHTPEPFGYTDRWIFADAMFAAGARQKRCPVCRRWAIWTEPARPVDYPPRERR